MVKSSIDKSSNYRDRLLKEIDSKHPIEMGIDMQAHHLISEKAVNLSKLQDELIGGGYDINNIANLVFLPCTLPGACHLGVQLHRGDHTFKVDDHPKSYHIEVKDRVTNLEEKLEKKCEQNKSVQSLLDKESKQILDDIASFELRLTRIYKSFTSKPHNKIGCGNADSVANHKNNDCLKYRNHFKDIPMQKYKLEVGR